MTNAPREEAAIRQVSFFSIKVSPTKENKLSTVVVVLKNGEATNLQPEGNTLTAQYSVRNLFLLLLTHNSPYEEALHIYLVDADNSILDQTHLGQPYTAGIFQELQCCDNVLYFSFFGNDAWRLHVLSSPRLMRPGANLPQVALSWKSLFMKRYLKLARIKP